MRTTRQSQTAQIAALIRATELLASPSPVLVDAQAVAMLPARWRAVLARPWLRRLLVERCFLGALDGGAGGVLARGRFHLDVLHDAMGAGVRQHVLLGAGLDCTGIHGTGLARFEVDHPASQAAKLARLHSARVDVSSTRFVTHDLQHCGLGGSLERAGFDLHAPALVAWLGCAQYLAPQHIHGVLSELSSVLCAGSLLVVDFLAHAPQTPARRLGSLLGEPLRSHHDPQTFRHVLAQHGLTVVEHVDPAAAAARWFTSTVARPVPPPMHTHLMKAVRQ